jgi:orotate phosphoribosyltransferase
VRVEVAEVRRLLEETQALLTGHFLLSSGLHSDRYFQCARVLMWPARASLLGAGIGGKWAEEPIDAVVGPAIGGILIAHEVARYLGTPSFFTEREEKVMRLRRGFALERGQRALVIEDVVTTGGSAQEVVALLRELGVEVAGVSSIVWRAPASNASNPFGELSFRPLLTLPTEAWSEADCPLCKAGRPFVKPGSRALEGGGGALSAAAPKSLLE